MTEIIVKALEITGQRGIINKGWGGLGTCKFLSLVCFAVFCLAYIQILLTEFRIFGSGRTKRFCISTGQLPSRLAFSAV